MTDWIRKKRGETWGPWHEWTGFLTRCGKRMRGHVDGSTDLGQAEGNTKICQDCVRLRERGEQRSFRR